MLGLVLILFAAAPVSVSDVSKSGRVVEIAVSPSERVSPPRQVAPGAPPVLSFRLFEAAAKHRASGLDLVLDDAGH